MMGLYFGNAKGESTMWKLRITNMTGKVHILSVRSKVQYGPTEMQQRLFQYARDNQIGWHTLTIEQFFGE